MIKNENGKYDVVIGEQNLELDRMPNIGEYIIYNDTTYKYIKL